MAHASPHHDLDQESVPVKSPSLMDINDVHLLPGHTGSATEAKSLFSKLFSFFKHTC